MANRHTVAAISGQPCLNPALRGKEGGNAVSTEFRCRPNYLLPAPNNSGISRQIDGDGSSYHHRVLNACAVTQAFLADSAGRATSCHGGGKTAWWVSRSLPRNGSPAAS
jgi:hypothetical protein